MKTIDDIIKQIDGEKRILDAIGHDFDVGELSLASYSIKKAGIEGTIKALEWVIQEEASNQKESAQLPKGDDGAKPPTLDELCEIVRDELHENSKEYWKQAAIATSFIHHGGFHMLVFSRHVNETAIITTPDGTRIRVVLIDIRGDKARIGIEAPIEYSVHRSEVQARIDNGEKPRMRP